MTPEKIARLPYRPCVGIMLLNRKDEVFVAQRLDSPGPAWQMPQGGIDAGETPIEAAWREMGEEIGTTEALLLSESTDWHRYDLPHDLVPKVWKGRYRGQEQKWFAFRFLGTDSDINIETEHREFSRWKWAPIDQVPGLIIPFKRAIYESVIQEFAHLAGRR